MGDCKRFTLSSVSENSKADAGRFYIIRPLSSLFHVDEINIVMTVVGASDETVKGWIMVDGTTAISADARPGGMVVAAGYSYATASVDFGGSLFSC